MKLHVLFGQRFQAYEGQYAPEALAVIDEFAYDETSGAWIYEQHDTHQKAGEFKALRIVTINISHDELDLIFKPQPLTGTIDADTSQKHDAGPAVNTIMDKIAGTYTDTKLAAKIDAVTLESVCNWEEAKEDVVNGLMKEFEVPADLVKGVTRALSNKYLSIRADVSD